MDSAVIVAIISGAFSLIGAFGGIMASSKLSAYRIEQLEKKVDKHNQVIERVYKLEQDVAVINKEIIMANDQIQDLEDYHK